MQETLTISAIDLGEEGLRIEKVETYGTAKENERKLDLLLYFSEPKSKISFKVQYASGRDHGFPCALMLLF